MDIEGSGCDLQRRLQGQSRPWSLVGTSSHNLHTFHSVRFTSTQMGSLSYIWGSCRPMASSVSALVFLICKMGRIKPSSKAGVRMKGDAEH